MTSLFTFKTLSSALTVKKKIKNSSGHVAIALEAFPSTAWLNLVQQLEGQTGVLVVQQSVLCLLAISTLMSIYVKVHICGLVWPFHSGFRLLSFLWSSRGIESQLCRFQACFCGRSHHPNLPRLPGTYGSRMDWTEGRQSRPDKRRLRRSRFQHTSYERWSALPLNYHTHCD